MTVFTACDFISGQVLFSGTADVPQALASAGIRIVEEMSPENSYYSGEEWIEIPERPSGNAEWNWTTHAWEA